MKRELHIFLTAVMFYTRIPCPAWVDHNPVYINLSIRYFPLIGWIIGGFYALVILLASNLFHPLLSVLLGLVTSILLTGAFHEDGFADVCDGFGGGWTKEKILTIMKDSRVGTYGVTGLILMIGLKTGTTVELLERYSSTVFFLVVITSHTISRTLAMAIIWGLSYARDEEDSKAKPVANGIDLSSTLIGAVFGLLPLIALTFLTSWLIIISIVLPIVATIYLGRYFKKWIGGYTGDCLGATQQVTEMIFLLSILGLWKFM